MEALAPILLENPRGVLMARDELSGWFGGFDRYAGGKRGADASHWLSMHNGEMIIVDRKIREPRTVVVPQASVCVIGTIQPAILRRALGPEHRESGLAARLLLACPPRKPKKWTEADIHEEWEVQIARLVDRLYTLRHETGSDGRLRAPYVSLTPDAKAIWTEYFNRHAQEQVNLDDDLSAAWSKLEEFAARLALAVHYIRWAADDPTLESPDRVDAASMQTAVALAEWFKHEALRVYALLAETDDNREHRLLIEWIERRGGRVTVRDVQRGRGFATSDEAEAALNDLFRAGRGDWEPLEPSDVGGRPSQVFRLSDRTDIDKTPVNNGKDEVLSIVSSVSEAEINRRLAEAVTSEGTET